MHLAEQRNLNLHVYSSHNKYCGNTKQQAEGKQINMFFNLIKHIYRKKFRVKQKYMNASIKGMVQDGCT